MLLVSDMMSCEIAHTHQKCESFQDFRLFDFKYNYVNACVFLCKQDQLFINFYMVVTKRLKGLKKS